MENLNLKDTIKQLQDLDRLDSVHKDEDEKIRARRCGEDKLMQQRLAEIERSRKMEDELRQGKRQAEKETLMRTYRRVSEHLSRPSPALDSIILQKVSMETSTKGGQEIVCSQSSEAGPKFPTVQDKPQPLVEISDCQAQDDTAEQEIQPARISLSAADRDLIAAASLRDSTDPTQKRARISALADRGGGERIFPINRQCSRDQVQPKDKVVIFCSQYYILNECAICGKGQSSFKTGSNLIRSFGGHFAKHPQSFGGLTHGFQSMIKFCGIQIQDATDEWAKEREETLRFHSSPSLISQPPPKGISIPSKIDRDDAVDFQINRVMSSDPDSDQYEIDEETRTYTSPGYLKGVPVDKMGADLINEKGTWVTFEQAISKHRDHLDSLSSHLEGKNTATDGLKLALALKTFFTSSNSPMHPNQLLAEQYLPEAGLCDSFSALKGLRAALTKLNAAKFQGVQVNGALIEPRTWLSKRIWARLRCTSPSVPLIRLLSRFFEDDQLKEIVADTVAAATKREAASGECEGDDDERGDISSSHSLGNVRSFTPPAQDVKSDSFNEITGQKRKQDTRSPLENHRNPSRHHSTVQERGIVQASQESFTFQRYLKEGQSSPAALEEEDFSVDLRYNTFRSTLEASKRGEPEILRRFTKAPSPPQDSSCASNEPRNFTEAASLVAEPSRPSSYADGRLFTLSSLPPHAEPRRPRRRSSTSPPREAGRSQLPLDDSASNSGRGSYERDRDLVDPFGVYEDLATKRLERANRGDDRE